MPPLEDSTPPQIAWRGERPLAFSLTDYVRGQEIIHVEHEVDARWHGFLRLRFRGARSPQLLIAPVEPEPGAENPTGLRWALKFSAGRTPRIWSPSRSVLGDGPVAVQDLQRLVGKTFERIETGAQTDDDMAVAQCVFSDGTGALVMPHPLPLALSLTVGCVLLMRVIILEAIRRGPATPGEALLGQVSP